jgi:adenosylcobinamide-GDP ribazoletransferase
MIKNFISTISFLTIIPTPKKYSQNLEHSIIFFPLVGLLIGGILVLINFYGSYLFSEQIINMLILVSLVIITGGLHLDGLADTLDGFYAGKTKGDTLKIMDDVHIGAIGTIGIVLILLAKLTLINNIPKNIFNLTLLITPVIGRWAMVLSMQILKSAKENGLGNFFVKNMSLKDFTISAIITLVIVIFLFQIKGILILLIISLVVLAFSIYTAKKIGGLTGDTLGAINEISELLVLLILSMKI